MNFKTHYILFLILSFYQIKSQSNYPKNYFSKPLNSQILLAGTFGELRSNHFHSGIDIKTKSVGLSVKATANGYISRIKVSPSGYGRAIYINHPNGYTTVYGHLEKFNQKIEKFIREKQYAKEKYSIDIRPKPNQIKVIKNQIIAYSGNSGYSGGPHLHYEIRKTSNQNPLNPLLFGIKVLDKSKPLIKNVFLYEKYNLENPKKIDFKENPTIYVNDDFAIGISTLDLFNNGENKNGVYKIEVSVNNVKKYSHTMNQISFATSRFINNHIDYKYYKNNKIKIQKCFRHGNNKLKIYDFINNNGFINTAPNQKYSIKITVSDFENNTSSREFTVICDDKFEAEQISNSDLFMWDQPNSIIFENIELNFPRGSFYHNLDFKFEKLNESTFSIHNDRTALQKNFTIKIKPEFTTDLNKTVIVFYNEKSGKFESVGGKLKNGFIMSKTRNLGIFSLQKDFTPPKIKHYKPKKIYTKNNKLFVKITDNLSRVKSYTSKLNGNWVLTYYDKKSNRIVLNLKTENTKKGQNILTINARDKKQNKSSKIIIFEMK